MDNLYREYSRFDDWWIYKGWLTGLLTGAIYVFGVMFYQFLAYDYWLADRQATYFLIFLIAAITGSMFGVNFSKNES